MNTQKVTNHTKYGVRQTTINKLCVALTELTTKIEPDKPCNNLYDTFVAYCKRYKISKNLYYTMKSLGYIKGDRNAQVLKINRQEVNQTIAKIIINAYNEKTYTKLKERKSKSPTKNVLIDKDEQQKTESGMFIVISEEKFKEYIERVGLMTLEDCKKHNQVGKYKVLKIFGELDVKPTTSLKLF